MKLSRSLLCLPVFAVLSFASCTQMSGTGGSGTTVAGGTGYTAIHGHRIGLVDPATADAFGGHGGGYGNNYAFFPMPTERYGDYFRYEDYPSLVGNNYGRYSTMVPKPAQSYPPAQAAPAPQYTSSK